jgi:RNA binding exosome subunit
MDQELKQYLEAMESRMDNRMVRLMTDVKESLERQIEHLSSRFDAQAIRLDRQAALLQNENRTL